MPLNRGWSYLRAQSIATQLRRAKLNDKSPNLPIIYLPGILGSKLFDRSKQAFIWGIIVAFSRKAIMSIRLLLPIPLVIS
ncbi:hypothetical protein [Providencia stuartii]|uniref:hypothetical protein n=1 Tax=Providencia stuartii TaxID=588 RepID=UPI000B086336|nr:hypothetical protein [Providencia stuartii]